MDKLTNEEIVRVFAMYLGGSMQSWDGKPFILRGVSMSPYGTIYIHAVPHFDGYYSKEKLLLTPLASITDEDAIEVSSIFGGSDHLSDESKVFQVKELISTNRLFNQQTNISGSRWYYSLQYLLSKNYAVPLFFSPDHWANGKTAIELGIALDKTTIKY